MPRNLPSPQDVPPSVQHAIASAFLSGTVLFQALWPALVLEARQNKSFLQKGWCISVIWDTLDHFWWLPCHSNPNFPPYTWLLEGSSEDCLEWSFCLAGASENIPKSHYFLQEASMRALRGKHVGGTGPRHHPGAPSQSFASRFLRSKEAISPTSNDAKSKTPSPRDGVPPGMCHRGISIPEKKQNRAIHRQLFSNIGDVIEVSLSKNLSRREEK